MEYNRLIFDIYNEVRNSPNDGEIAAYIPELANVDSSQFGISLIDFNNGIHNAGDAQIKFSIQSISKLFSLSMAMSITKDKLWKRVGVEPSGNPYNSMVQLEYEQGIPRNPFINAGALVVADILVSELGNPKDELLQFVRTLSNSESVTINEKVALSEKETGYNNAALINMMKAHYNIVNDIDKVLDFYFYQCSIEMSCQELAQSMLCYTYNNPEFRVGQYVLTKSQIKRINALMLSCGFYDESGEFAFKVGLPGKSGVGGGIVAIYPEEYSVAVWSPKLNKKGNSVWGMNALELLTTKLGTSIF